MVVQGIYKGLIRCAVQNPGLIVLLSPSADWSRLGFAGTWPPSNFAANLCRSLVESSFLSSC